MKKMKMMMMTWRRRRRKWKSLVKTWTQKDLHQVLPPPLPRTMLPLLKKV